MKKLKTKKLFLAVLFSNLKSLKTEDFQTDDQLLQFRKIKEAFKSKLSDYVKLWDQSEENRQLFISEKLKGEELQKRVNEINIKFGKLDQENKDKNIELELEDADFNLLFDLFGKIGKKTFQNPDQYIEFKDQLNEANKQPKSK
jgi:hypothetical protein